MSIYRSVWLPSAVISAFLLVSLGMQMVLSWQSLERVSPVHDHLRQLATLQDMGLHLEGRLIDLPAGDTQFSAEEGDMLAERLKRIAAVDAYLVPESRIRLLSAAEAFSAGVQHPKSALNQILWEIRRVLRMEMRAHDELLTEVKRRTAAELEMAAVTLVAFPLLVLLILYSLRRRILIPLKNLGHLMKLLAGRDFTRAPTRDVDPLVRPLTENYNYLVTRLAELEKADRGRRRALENQVQAVTQALLEQQRELARADQLAAIGVLAARIAHELRNPMASIEMSLSNLQDEVPDAGHANRLGRVIDELNRMALLLENLLNQTRHTPEAPRELPLAATIDDLLELIRYQVPSTIRVLNRVPQDLHCRLPENRLRQSLLNVILNAVQAMADNTGTIEITANVRDWMLVLNIRDDGPGFPEAILRCGVQTFLSGRSGGTGLGLATVQSFCRDQGGTLELSNLSPNGASVSLKLACDCRVDLPVEEGDRKA